MPQDMKEYRRKYYQQNKDKWHKSYIKHREEKRIRNRKWRLHNKVSKLTARLYMRNWTKATKIEVLTHYGNGKLACVKCGFDDIRALSIDHINGEGKAHRILIRKGGIRFYRWLKRQGYPKEYQTLCMNCQWIKRQENNECNRIVATKA